MNETKRIIKAYKKRDSLLKSSSPYFSNPAYLYGYQQREKYILDMLASFNFSNLSEKKILDIGCGDGKVLLDFIKYGAEPKNCYGIDLLPDRIKTARQYSSSIEFICNNAESLPYNNEFFDLILAFTVFTSILDDHMKHNIANEIMRVLKSNGIILWYDYFFNNPKNFDVRGVKKKEISKLFHGCNIYLHRVSLAPPIARVVAPHSKIICTFLENIKLLNTHYLGVIVKK